MLISKKTSLSFPIAILFLLIINTAQSQSPVYKNYTVNDGLPSQVVYCALQDKQGFMWFGTDAGVSRFDGKHFQNFTSKDGLSDNEVLKIYQDSQDRIWFLMLNGTLSYIFEGQIHSRLNDKTLESAKTRLELMSFLEDDQHNLWFGSAGKEAILISYTNEIQVLHLDSLGIYTSNRLVYAIQNDKQVLIIVGAYLYKVNNLKFTFVDSTCYISKNLPFVVEDKLDSNKSVASFNDGLRVIEDGSSRLILGKEKIPSYESIQRIYVDPENGIWLLTSSLNTIYFAKTISGYQFRKSYLNGTYMGAVLIDEESNKWFCTVGKGIFKLSHDEDQVKVFEGNSAIDKNEIWSVNLDRYDNIWFGTGARNLYRIMGDSIVFEINLGDEDVRMGRVTRIDFDSLNNVWCSVSNGVIFIHDSLNIDFYLESVKTLTNLKTFNAKYIAFDRNNKVYFSSIRGIQQIFRLNGGLVFKSYVPEKLDPGGRVSSLYFDKNNIAWYEKFNLLISYNGKIVHEYTELAKEFRSQISCIQGFADSLLIISTYGNGIHFFKNGKIINRLSSADGLAGDLCRKLFVDSSIIYVATNQGFSYFNYKNNKISGLKTITTTDGIVSNDIKDIFARNGKIYLATSAGLCIVNKNISQLASKPPPLYVTSVSTKSSSTEKFRKLKFLYTTDFDINYIAITYEQPEKINYEYNITGNEKDWILTNNSSISFSSLSPGKYTFQLKAKKHNSDWSNITAIQFVVIPPLWQQWWLRIFAFFLLVASTYYLLKYFTERRYHEQLRILKERSRISADMHDDLGADLSNLLLMTRMSGKSGEIHDNKNQLGNLEQFANGLVSKVDEIIWALNPKNDTFQGFIHYTNDYLKNIAKISGIEVNIVLPDDSTNPPISAAFRRNLFLVIKEALNNIVRHSQANKVFVLMILEGNFFEIRIEDNGDGFDGRTFSSNSDGLLNMEKRIREIDGSFNVKSSIANGTSIYVKVPLE